MLDLTKDFLQNVKSGRAQTSKLIIFHDKPSFMIEFSARDAAHFCFSPYWSYFFAKVLTTFEKNFFSAKNEHNFTCSAGKYSAGRNISYDTLSEGLSRRKLSCTHPKLKFLKKIFSARKMHTTSLVPRGNILRSGIFLTIHFRRACPDESYRVFAFVFKKHLRYTAFYVIIRH